MLRAIHVGDVLNPNCPVFEYNPNTRNFHMIEDEEMEYEYEKVIDSHEWIVFSISEGGVAMLDNSKFFTKE